MCTFSIQSQKNRCHLCHAPASDGQLLCGPCYDSLPHLRHSCPSCALPLTEQTPTQGLCGECLAEPPAFDRTLAPLCYRHPVNELISRFKYRQTLSDGNLLARLLARHVQQQASQAQLLLPMPLHPARLRLRGYNQAAELARVLSRITGIPWDPHLLRRGHEGPSQREARRSERLRNVRSAFVCASQRLPQRVAIIDDVITTGATARAAAASVRQAGANWVEIWAIARTPRHGAP